jgi:NADPH-dependent curcumin reductase CurA
MCEWHAAGWVSCRVEVCDGFEVEPCNITRLLDGSHNGKLIIKAGWGRLQRAQVPRSYL